MSIAVSKTCTLRDFVEAKPSSQLSYYSLSLLEREVNTSTVYRKNNVLEYDTHVNVIEYDVYNVMSDYINDLKALSSVVTLSDSEYYTYRFRPKLLADYLYGNGELYFIILWLNDIWTVKDFDMRSVRLVSKSVLSNVLSNINSSERSFIEAYNESANSTEI